VDKAVDVTMSVVTTVEAGLVTPLIIVSLTGTERVDPGTEVVAVTITVVV